MYRRSRVLCCAGLGIYIEIICGKVCDMSSHIPHDIIVISWQVLTPRADRVYFPFTRPVSYRPIEEAAERFGQDYSLSVSLKRPAFPPSFVNLPDRMRIKPSRINFRISTGTALAISVAHKAPSLRISSSSCTHDNARKWNQWIKICSMFFGFFVSCERAVCTKSRYKSTDKSSAIFRHTNLEC